MSFRCFVFLVFYYGYSCGASVFAGNSDTLYKPINDSTIDGRYRQYNDSHQLVFEGKYKNGLRQGIFKEYDTSGLLLTKSKYKQGKLYWQQLYKNGKIYATIDKKGVYRKRKECGC